MFHFGSLRILYDSHLLTFSNHGLRTGKNDGSGASACKSYCNFVRVGSKSLQIISRICRYGDEEVNEEEGALSSGTLQYVGKTSTLSKLEILISNSFAWQAILVC